MRIKRKLRNILLASTLVLGTTAASAQNWANVQPAFNTSSKSATVRVEGGAKLSDKWNFYGFADVDATEEKPLDFENWYGEARFLRNLGETNFGALVEYNGGTGADDMIRLGAQWAPNLGKKNFTTLRATYNTEGDSQLGLFSSQDIGKWGVSLLAEYNDFEKIYGEIEVSRRLTEKIRAFAQARAFGKPSDLEAVAVTGVKYSF